MATPFENNVQNWAAHPDIYAKLPNKEFIAQGQGITVEQLDALVEKAKLSLPKVAKQSVISRPDMPKKVLEGTKLGKWCQERMGDFCVAYAWLPLLTAANMLIKPVEDNARQTNLYVSLVGDPNSGKSYAQDRANYLFGLEARGLVNTESFGSAEGMLEAIGDQNGGPYLWTMDEIAHVMLKAGIKGASFYAVLNTLFYKARYRSTVSNRKKVRFNARLTFSGGTVEEKFDECFGAGSEGGMYDRFLFGLQPTGFKYQYRGEHEAFGAPLIPLPAQPFDGTTPVAFEKRFEVPRIHQDVHEARHSIFVGEKINGRVLELVIRAALICAAWDEHKELRASYLEPFWELARYQEKCRKLLPIKGLTYDAQAGEKALNWLRANNGDGAWFSYRAVCRGANIYKFGSATCERAVKAYVFSGEIEEAYVQSPKGGPKKWILRAAKDDE